MNTREIVQEAATDLLAHRHKLTGKAEEADRARTALEAAARAIGEHRDRHRTDAATATSHWNGKGAAAFDRRANQLTASLNRAATTASRGTEIVSAAAASVAGNRTAVNRLIEEYTAKAADVLDGALGAKGAGSQAALVKAVAKIRELIAHYTAQSAKQLHAAQHELRESAKQLKGLTPENEETKDPMKPQRKPGDRRNLRDKVTKIARGELGYQEGPGNTNKYGPAAPWCSSFASWVWRKAGVDIPITPFTGNMYYWGQKHGLAYDSHHLSQARPGDVLLFGSGPQSPSTSTHIRIVESVHGDRVTLIEGNSSDRVQRVTHTLSSATFYGGVHPR